MRPGDPFEARMLRGKLVISNRAKLSAKQRRELCFTRGLHAWVENAVSVSRLLPCPFCGSRATLFPDKDDEGLYEVGCSGCGARTHPLAHYTEDQAVAAWNWRIEIPKAVKASVKPLKRKPVK